MDQVGDSRPLLGWWVEDACKEKKRKEKKTMNPQSNGI